MTMPLSGFTPGTPGRLVVGEGVVMINYGLAGERALGATRGGNTFDPGITYRDIETDRTRGMVKGLRVLDQVNPTITANLLEVSAENLLAVIPGLESAAALATVTVVAQFVGAGTGVATAFNLGATNIVADSERIYFDAGAGDPVLQAASTYTLVDSTGAITFTVAPPSGTNITATYSYATGGAATHDTLTINELADADYLPNVALIGTVNNKTQPIVCIIRNAIVDAAPALALVSRGEPVMSVTFRGMYDSSNMGLHPFELRYPRS